MSSNYGFEPTLDGLNTIDADSTTTTDIICDNLTVNVSGTAPTMTGGDNSTHLATTAFVSNAISTIGSSYVTLTGTQTISGEKTFSNANTYITGLATFSNGAQFNTVLPTSSVVPVSGTQLTNKTYVDSVSGGSALLSSTNTFTGTNTFNNSNNVFEATSIAANSATVLNIATNTNRTHAINIGNGTNATCNISIGDLRSSTGSIKIGSGASSGNILLLDSAYIGIGQTTLTTNIINIGQANSTITMAGNFNFIPVGTINTSVVSTVPNGFLYCDGTAVSRSTYSVLFAAISTTFGVGNGITTFNVPNFKGAFLRGASTQTVSGVAYTAAAVGTVQQDMALTTPQSGYSTPFESTGFRSCSGGVRDCLARTTQGDTPENPTGLSLAYPTGRFGTEVRPMNYSVYYFIKY